MIFPNKHIKIEESILYKMTLILDYNSYNEISIKDLWMMTHEKFNNIDEFVFSLDMLYLLDKIQIDFESKKLIYVS